MFRKQTDKVDMSLNLICLKSKRESEGARTFQVSATRFWNSLSSEIKEVFI